MRKHPLSIGFAFALAGCAMTNQLHSELDYRGDTPSSLLAEGIGVLTPSAPTGQESDKQALADALSSAMESSEESGRVMPLIDILSAINSSGLARPYANMLADYEAT